MERQTPLAETLEKCQNYLIVTRFIIKIYLHPIKLAMFHFSPKKRLKKILSLFKKSFASIYGNGTIMFQGLDIEKWLKENADEICKQIKHQTSLSCGAFNILSLPFMTDCFSWFHCQTFWHFG